MSVCVCVCIYNIEYWIWKAVGDHLDLNHHLTEKGIRERLREVSSAEVIYILFSNLRENIA